MRYLFLFLFLAPISLLAQTNETIRLEKLEQLRVEFTYSFSEQQSRAIEYANRNNIPLKQYLPSGNLMQLVDVDLFGQPVYRETINSGLAISTGVTKLRADGGLGLNLMGEGIEVGVWDGAPTFDHIEFVDRILTKESGTPIDHATHVSGTILATGLNSSAMGMATKAKLHSFDWNNDRAEMIAKAQQGLLFSNHSYSIALGWNCSNGSCSWLGQPAISDREDWRFGFYTTLAKDLDNIAFNAPYYSIFWAAGNDRGQTATIGAATYPPDGNQGSGYDCVVQEGTAKNIFTIGAVRKVPSYSGPLSVEMSSFSGWGPTDDGRIKPDLVAPGVNIFSTVTDNNYGSSSGTSMATPGALGSLTLLQELFRTLSGGNFMRSATLKALAIHTAKEAGQHPGPDYSFGWGLVDVEAASKVLLSQDNQNVFVQELELTNAQSYELLLTPKSNTKITATIAWTDPAGNPVGSSLDPTNLMLVNDLDMQIADDANNKQLPWVLDPDLAALGEAAYKADNFRDNVEKIEFENPEPRSYTLKINHKGTLVGGSQKFSLIITYTSLIEPQVAYYWVGGNGDWNDPGHWALTSGGTSAGTVPNQNNRVVVDENSFSGDSEMILLSKNSTVGSITWLNKSRTGISLNGNTLTVLGNFILSSEKTELTSGKILFTGTLNDENIVITNNTIFTDTDLEINSTSTIEMRGGLKANSVSFFSGSLNMEGFNLEANTFKVSTESSKFLNFSGASFDITNLNFNSTTLTVVSEGSTISAAPNAIIDLGNRLFEGNLIFDNENGTLLGDNNLKKIEVHGQLKVSGNNTISDLTLDGGSTFTLNAGTVQQLSETTLISSTETKRVVIEGLSGKASLNFDGRFKLCFDNLDITNVDATGDAVVNAGLLSSLNNSINWAKDNCSDILFSDFDFSGNCAGGLIQLLDKSLGAAEAWAWNTNSGSASLIRQNEKNAAIIFQETGDFEISLTISNDNDSRTFTRNISVVENDLPTNEIIINGLNLFSSQPGSTYQWFKDFNVIPNASGRSYPFNGEPGTYYVLTNSNTCSRVSSLVLITGLLDDTNQTFDELQIYPNPAEDRIYINGLMTRSEIRIKNAAGQTIYEVMALQNVSVITSSWARGIYFIQIVNDKGVSVRKILLK